MNKHDLLRGAAFPPHAQLFAIALQTVERSGQALAAPLLTVRGGLVVRWSRYVTLLAAALMALAPFQAAAQESVSVNERARPEYDPLGRRVGAFDLNATLDLGLTSTSNVFAAETGEQDDVIYFAAPSARLESNWLRHAIGAVAGARFTQFADLSSQDVNTGFVSGFGRLDISRDTTIHATARLAREAERRTDPDAPVTGDPVEFESNNFAVTAQHVFNRFRGTLELGHGNSNFKGAQSFRDVKEDRVRARVDTELTPRIGVFVEARVDQRKYQNDPAFDSDGQSFYAGVQLNLTDLIVGEVSAGHFKRDFNNGANIEGVAVRGDVRWYVTRLTTIHLTATRDSGETGGVVISPYVDSNLGVRVDHELLRNVIIGAGVQAGRREYDVLDRQDEYSTIDLTAQYFVNRHLALNARVSRETSDSTGANRYRDYEVDAVTLGASFRL